MKVTVKSGNAAKQKTSCLVLFTSKNGTHPNFNSIDKETGHQLSALIKRGDLKQSSGQTLMVPTVANLKAERILLASLGKEQPNAVEAEKVINAVATSLKNARIADATVVFDDVQVSDREPAWLVQMLSRCLANAAYTFTEYKSKKEDEPAPIVLTDITLLQASKKVPETLKKAAEEGAAIAIGMAFTRNLGNQPGNVCTPKYLTAQAKELAKECKQLTVKALGEKEMEKLGMFSFLSVAKGSSEEGQLITMEYKGGKKGEQPIVLLGKGITFDTGGISLKPGLNMDEMKFDMCGAATVFGAMKAIIQLQLPINVVGMVAAAENMPAGHASKPGDIVTSMSGQTIEILNTDAEGRLVLCDALTYAERFKPKAVIDMATLTGACIIALGHHTSALMSNNDELANKLFEAGQITGDKTWRMPLAEEYDNQLKSNFADMANIGTPGAGTITAGCFLARFAKAYPWAHLDIAGIAHKGGAEKGATGRPVPLLMQYVLSQL